MLLPKKAIILIKAFERYFPLIWYCLCGKECSEICSLPVHEILCRYNSSYQRSLKATEQCSLLVLFTLLYCSYSFNLCGKKYCSGISLNMKPPLQYFLHGSFLFPVYHIMELIGSFDLGHSVNGILFTEAFPC